MLLDLPLEIGNGFGGGIDELFRLADVEVGSRAMSLENLSQLQRLLPGSQGTLGDLKFAIERPKLEIGRCHVCNEGRNHRPLPPLACKHLGPSGFGLPPVFSPKVEIPDHR